MPLELNAYFNFRQILDNLEEQGKLTPSVILDLADQDLKDNEMIQFIKFFFKDYYLNFFRKALTQYHINFRSMLRAEFLYEFSNLIQSELKDLSKRIEFYKKQRDKLPSAYALIDNYMFLDLYDHAKRLLKNHSRNMIRNLNLSNGESVINLLVYNALNALIKKVKSELKWDHKEDLESILEFRNFLHEIKIKDNLDYREVPRIYLELTNYENFFKILQEYNVDFLFLPRHDIYVVVKKKYDPNLAEISKMCEKGGVGYKDIADRFGVSTLEAELILQLLIRRKMMAHTYSYLRGDEFFLLKI